LRLFLTFVGDRDPYWRAIPPDTGKVREPFDPSASYDLTDPSTREGPILSFLKKIQPGPGDRVCLIPTKRDPKQPGSDRLRTETWPGACQLRAELANRYPDVEVDVRPLVNVDIGDFEDVIPAVRRLFTEVAQNSSQSAHWLVLVSPGTPQMQAAWYVLAHEGRLRADLYRVTDDGQVSQLHVEPLFEYEWKRLGLQHFRFFLFPAAAATFSELASRAHSPERREAAAFFANLAEIYYLWHTFQYREASDRLRQLTVPSFCPSPLRDLLERQRQALGALKGSARQYDREAFKDRAIDLYHGARLKVAVREYGEALWRAASAYEQLLLDRALSAFELRFCGWRPDPYAFRNSLEQAYRRFRQQKDDTHARTLLDIVRNLVGGRPGNTAQDLFEKVEPFLYVELAWKILLVSECGLGMELEQRVRDKLLRARNMVLHRASPVSEEDAKGGLEVLIEIMGVHFGARVQGEIKSWPLSKEALEQVAQAADDLV
jgi:hypothetical protein